MEVPEEKQELIMKALKTKILNCLVVLILLTGCEKDHMFDCFKSTGSIVRETRTVSDFNRIDVYNNVDVIITQDTLNSVTAEAGENIISGITTNIDGGILTIRNENKCNWVRSFSKTIVVYVHAKKLSIIHHHGSATVSSVNTLEGSTIDLNVWSSGDINVSVHADYVYSRQHSTVGDMTLSGKTTGCYIFNAGNAFTYGKELEIQNCDMEQRGTGDIYVNVTHTFSVSIYDSGNVYYTGNPQVTSSVTGTGSLVHQ
jgi:hypothetical protein